MTPSAKRDQKPYRFARFVAILRERYWAVLFTIILVGAAVFGVSLLVQPRYSATAQVQYSARDAQWASQVLTASGTAALVHNISSDAFTLRTTAFATRVSSTLGGIPSVEELRSSIQITSDPEAELIEIMASGPDPVKVADIADAYANEFVKVRQEQIEESLAQAESLVQNRINSLTKEEAASERGATLKEQYDNLAVLLSMKIKDYEVLQQAIVPTSPYSPRSYLNLLIGLAAGLVLGLIVALLLNYFDRRIKDQSTLERVMDMPVLGIMPVRKRAKSGSPSARVGFAGGNDALLESIRMLRSNLKVLGFGENRRSVLITSTTPSESKSTLAVDLTLGMALAGDRVILVDADLRNPMIHQCLGIPNEQGLGDTLLDRDVSWSTTVQAVDLSAFVSPELNLARKPAGKEAPISKFLCLTSGSLPSNPTEILESEAWPHVLGELQGVSDYVILDGPPMLVASDSLILAQSVDAVILVNTLGNETAAEAAQVKQLLARAEIPVLGIVICGAKAQNRDAHYYDRPGSDGRAAARRGT